MSAGRARRHSALQGCEGQAGVQDAGRLKGLAAWLPCPQGQQTATGNCELRMHLYMACVHIACAQPPVHGCAARPWQPAVPRLCTQAAFVAQKPTRCLHRGMHACIAVWRGAVATHACNPPPDAAQGGSSSSGGSAWDDQPDPSARLLLLALPFGIMAATLAFLSMLASILTTTCASVMAGLCTSLAAAAGATAVAVGASLAGAAVGVSVAVGAAVLLPLYLVLAPVVGFGVFSAVAAGAEAAVALSRELSSPPRQPDEGGESSEEADEERRQRPGSKARADLVADDVLGGSVLLLVAVPLFCMASECVASAWSGTACGAGGRSSSSSSFGGWGGGGGGAVAGSI